MDQPETGGRWVRDPQTGALSKLEEPVGSPEPATEADTETDVKAEKPTTAKRGEA
ncbi:hypothetical protein ABID16_000049 [Rhizobium aquaticum]|uniref:Uncharacterized protein n=1 Tax=Rhizobium aquaticum TaxID=1549636 RepID=A0ABV2ITD4_9HYPH